MTMISSDHNHADPGIVLAINKPVDWTSFDVVNKIRYITKVKKVGHAGTLDPFATGVLIVCLGRSATRRVDEFMGQSKEYLATIALGQETDTMDLTGQEILSAPVPTLTSTQVEAVLEGFCGRIVQEIPAFSAAKVNGKRLYKLARAGKEVPQKTKEVQVDSIKLEALTPTSILIRVVCGKGTYIRTLGRDIARSLGSAGHLSKLIRTRVGEFDLDQALSLPDFEEKWRSRADDLRSA